jgi:RimJ/RimL family protein N-acetyltransferase
MTQPTIPRRARAEFVVVRSADGVRLGRVGLGLDGIGAAQVGYWMDPAARSRGVATRAVRALCRWGFAGLGLGLIEWRAEVGNTASRRVAEKAGFTVEAVLRRRLVHRGMRVDAWIGSMLPDDSMLPGEVGAPGAAGVTDTPGVGGSGESGLG